MSAIAKMLAAALHSSMTEEVKEEVKKDPVSELKDELAPHMKRFADEVVGCYRQLIVAR